MPLSEDLAAPAALLGVLVKVDFVLVAVDVENMLLALPFVGDSGDRYYSNLESISDRCAFRDGSPGQHFQMLHILNI